MNIFSHPAFPSIDTFSTVGYNLFVSRAINGGPNYYGPWNAVPGYTNYTNNQDITDMFGTPWDLYRVQPIIVNTTNNVPGPPLLLDMSRPFRASTPLYDTQISAYIPTFRQSYLDDAPISQVESTVPTESTGPGAAPFITDADTSRYFLAFLPNAEPVKFIAENTLVYAGADAFTAQPLVAYQDYYPHGDKGYIDFKTNPPLDSYLRVEYQQVRYSNDECRNMLVNAISDLSLYQINGFAVLDSWNLYYMAVPLGQRDLGEIVCSIGQHNLLGSNVISAFQRSEAWKDGKVEYTSDPSRSIQAGTAWHTDLKQAIREKANSYIINNRQYFSRGEFDSFFDNSGIFYPPFSTFNVFNYYSWWL